MKSNASWKYCLIFWWGVSLAGICLYLSPDLICVAGDWQVTFNTQFAPTLVGSMASRPLPKSRWGKSADAGCVSISAIKARNKKKEIEKLHQSRLQTPFFKTTHVLIKWI